MQLVAASTMMNQYGNLPPGWQCSIKIVDQWEWRCPRWAECGNRRVLYTKSTADEALNAGKWHLFNKEHHPDPGYTWAEATYLSSDGISLYTKEVYITIDDSEEEIEPPTRLRWENKGKGKGKSDAADYGGGRRRSRSRDRRLH